MFQFILVETLDLSIFHSNLDQSCPHGACHAGTDLGFFVPVKRTSNVSCKLYIQDGQMQRYLYFLYYILLSYRSCMKVVHEGRA